MKATEDSRSLVQVAAAPLAGRAGNGPGAGRPSTGRQGPGPGQVDGVRFSEVDTAAAVAANDSGSVAGLRDAALLAVASDGLLRVQSPAMPGHYARGQLAARGAVARVRYGRG